MLLLSVYGDHINQVTDGYTTSTTTSTGSSASKPLGVSGSVGYSSMSGLGSNLSSGLGMAHTSEYRGKLNDAEEFVRVMLQVNASTALTTTAFTTTTTATADSRSQSYATDLRESFSSTTSSSRASHSNNINRLHPANGGPVVRRLFAEEASQQQQQQRSYGHSVGSTSSSGHGIHTTTSAASVTSHATSHGAASGGTSGGTAGASTGSRSYVVSRSSFAPSPTNANINSGTGEDAAPQLLRSPPPEFKPDFDA